MVPRAGNSARVRARWFVLLAVIVVAAGAGCGSQAVRSLPPTAHRSGSAMTRPVWLQSLYMTSARVGWALHWTGNPARRAGAALVPARTTDGGWAWMDVAPPAALRMLARGYADVAFHAAGDRRAWLAVTVARSEAGCATPHRTEVFGTADGGALLEPIAATPRARHRPVPRLCQPG
jgi:hypothetical protein